MQSPDFYKRYLNAQFGYLTVLERIASVPVGKKGKTTSLFLCKCKCGKSKSVKLTHLKNGHVKSCGCFKRSGSNNPNWQGYQTIPLHKFNSYRNGAILRGLEFSITIELCYELLETQKGLCNLTGLPIDIKTSASLDRIDSKRGYTPDNLQWVHKDVNRLKMDLPEDRMKYLCGKISRFNGIPTEINNKNNLNHYTFRRLWSNAELSLLD